MSIANIVQCNDTRAGRIFDWSVIVLIGVSMVSLTISTLPNLPDTFRRVQVFVEVAIVVLFSVEYCLRLVTAPKKLRYIFSVYGIVDLVAIVPFYLSSGTVDLTALRVVRLLRIIAILKLTRYRAAVDRFGKAIALAREELVLFAAVTAMLLYFAAVGIYYFEREAQPEAFPSIVHSLWWATATITTVGYGDVYPVTAGGRMFTFLVLVCGLGIVAVPAGLLASALTKVREEEDRDQ